MICLLSNKIEIKEKHFDMIMTDFVFQNVLKPLLDESPDEMGDLYLDVAEAYVEVGKLCCSAGCLRKIGP